MAKIGIETALAGHRPRLCAWNHESSAPPRYAVFELFGGGARFVAAAAVAPGERAAKTAELRGRGLRVGGYYGGHEFVWVADELGCTVWSREAVLFEATRAALGEVTAVVSSLGEDYVRREVRLERPGQPDLLVAGEDDAIAQLDPTYNWDNLLMSDVEWISACGRDLAAWLGVPHRGYRD